MIDFKDKKILVTGASGGIGHALVKKFVSLNANVLATGTKTEKLDSLKKEFPNINILKFDISDHSKIEEFVENVYSQLVGLDVLINNAGINKDNLSIRMKEDEWKKLIDINLSSTRYLLIILAAVFSLFLELSIIRFHSSFIHFFSFFKNISLISCFS